MAESRDFRVLKQLGMYDFSHVELGFGRKTGGGFESGGFGWGSDRQKIATSLEEKKIKPKCGFFCFSGFGALGYA